MKYQYYHFIATDNLVKKARQARNVNAEKSFAFGVVVFFNQLSIHALNKNCKEKSKSQLF